MMPHHDLPNTPPPTDPPPDAEWFREPTAREHRIAGGLFLVFGLFFTALFFVTAGFWFRWITLALGVFSCVRGLYHLRMSRRAR